LVTTLSRWWYLPPLLIPTRTARVVVRLCCNRRQCIPYVVPRIFFVNNASTAVLRCNPQLERVPVRPRQRQMTRFHALPSSRDMEQVYPPPVGVLFQTKRTAVCVCRTYSRHDEAYMPTAPP
ncbi:unnamed protein product, partial [Ectocarpus sp. 4 AP-2014]